MRRLLGLGTRSCLTGSERRKSIAAMSLIDWLWWVAWTDASRKFCPEPVAAAVVQFITGDLLSNPKKVGKALVGRLEGTWSARRGEYRVLYEINEETRAVTVVDVNHRSDVYGRRGRRRRRRP